MNLAILNTQQQEQKAIEEMKKYTDLFREEKSLDQTAVIELKNTDRDGYFIHREDDRILCLHKEVSGPYIGSNHIISLVMRVVGYGRSKNSSAYVLPLHVD